MEFCNVFFRTDANDVEGQPLQGLVQSWPTGQEAQPAQHSTWQSDQSTSHSGERQIDDDSWLAKPQVTQFMRTGIRPPPRAGFFFELPEYDYIMPIGPALNFTVAEILVILPHWHKNLQICQRFHNNGLNSSVHMTILQEHRDIALVGTEVSRAKDAISDQYRKTMRMADPKWRKAMHKAPENWDSNAVSVSQFVPDSAREKDYSAPASVSFKSMMRGITKVPQGSDAGDLTRALCFALAYQKPGPNGEAEEYLFPDDLHKILEYIGYTTITDSHTDRAIIGRNEKTINEAMNLQRKRRNGQQAVGYLPIQLPKRRHALCETGPMQPVQQQNAHTSEVCERLAEPFASIPAGLGATYAFISSPEGAEKILSDDPGFTGVDGAPAQHDEYDFLGLLTPSTEQSEFLQKLDESLETLQPPVWVNKTHYPDTQLLRGCVEADHLDDHSDLARAARYCRRPYSYATDYVVGQVDLILALEEVLGNVLE
jgi:hypothetical protein